MLSDQIVKENLLEKGERSDRQGETAGDRCAMLGGGGNIIFLFFT